MNLTTFQGLYTKAIEEPPYLKFTTGKVVIAGAKSENQLNDTVKEINKIVE